MKNDSINTNLTMRDSAILILQHRNILTGSSQQRQFQWNRLLVFSNKFCEVCKIRLLWICAYSTVNVRQHAAVRALLCLSKANSELIL